MLDALRPDALDIALSPAAHGTALRAAAARGIAALCQKPLAPTLAEAQALAAELAGGPRVASDSRRIDAGACSSGAC